VFWKDIIAGLSRRFIAIMSNCALLILLNLKIAKKLITFTIVRPNATPTHPAPELNASSKKQRIKDDGGHEADPELIHIARARNELKRF
jgi:hypothetical protein